MFLCVKIYVVLKCVMVYFYALLVVHFLLYLMFLNDNDNNDNTSLLYHTLQSYQFEEKNEMLNKLNDMKKV